MTNDELRELNKVGYIDVSLPQESTITSDKYYLGCPPNTFTSCDLCPLYTDNDLCVATSSALTPTQLCWLKYAKPELFL